MSRDRISQIKMILLAQTVEREAVRLPITLDPHSELPLYRQIARSVQEGIDAGRLPAGARLPAVRELADSLSVAPVTVHHAYALLRDRDLVESTVGRGTFIKESAGPMLEQATLQRPGEDRFSGHDGLPGPGTEGGLARAEPDPDPATAARFLELHREIADDPGLLVAYPAVEGEPRLREEVSKRLAARGIGCSADEVLITAGSTPALAALLPQLARPGDRVLVEEKTYFGFLSLLRAAGVEPVAVAMDRDGLDPGALESALLRERPRFLYVMPTFHNPVGASMPEGRRREVLSVAERYGLTIVEDDVFHELSYDGPPPRPLRAMASKAEVIYVDSFSKCLLPGLRLGFVLPPPGLRHGLAAALETATLTTPHLLQSTLAEYLRRGELDRHLERVRPVYRERRDALIAALDEHMPAGVGWTHPAGGLCCWVSLPPGGDWQDLARAAAHCKVGYAPGWRFDPYRRPVEGLRLCLGAVTQQTIDAQLRQLGDLIRDRLPAGEAARRAPTGSPPIV